MSHNPADREPLIDRARNIAIGLADTGLTHAEEVLRRMSPEGREQARRERKAKERRQKRLLVRLLVALILSLIGFAVGTVILSPLAAMAAASALFLVMTIVIFWHAEPSAAGREALVGAVLHDLAEEGSIWLAAQRRDLPTPALQLCNAICQQLDALAPKLGKLDPRASTAASIRKLISVELPDLIESWRSVPIATRGKPQPDGITADNHLLNGLGLIESEFTRLNEELSTWSEIAVQGRYLELKYKGETRLC